MKEIPSMPFAARQIIKQVLRDHVLCTEDFFGLNRDAHLVEARKDAAKRLFAEGRSYAAIARIMRRDRCTIVYYIDEDFRVKRNKRYGERMAHARFLSVFPPDLKTWIEIEAKREGREPAAVVREIVRDVAEHAEMCARDAA